MAWESADKVQKDDKGNFRANIGGQWTPVEKAQKSEEGKYRVQRFTPTDQVEESKPEEKSFIEKTKDFFTKGEEGHQFNPSEVYKSTLAGGVIGAGIGSIAGGVGAAPGAVGGAGVGFVSGIVGETARTMGASPAASMGYEFVSGGLSSIGKQATSILSKAYLNWHTKAAAKEGLKLSEEFGAPSIKSDAIGKAVKERVLGKKPESIPVEQTKNIDLINMSHQMELAQKGIVLKQGEKSTDVVRNQIYENMTKLTQSGKPFSTSSDMIALHTDLQTLLQRNLITKEQVSTINKILNNQKSLNPNVAAKANEDIVSLLQSGAVYSAKQDARQVISAEAKSALRNRVGEYYKSNVGKDALGFEELKVMEKQQFQAKALDAIPNMVRENFKDVTSKSFKEDMLNISNSGIEGKSTFAKAVASHFSDKAPEDFMREFNRLRKPLQESGIMDARSLDHLRVTLEHIPKDITKERWKQMAIRAFQGVASAEIHKEIPQ